MTFVSVIVPMYGVEAYIQETVLSVLQQTHTDFELILVDDESPDNSVSICKAINDPRIRIVHQRNRGLAGARNTGIRHSKGELIAFLDGDDLWAPGKLKAHIEHLEQRPEVGLSYSPSVLIDESGSPTGTYLSPQLKDIDVAYLFRSNPVGNGSAPVLRKAVLDEIAFEQTRYGELETFYFDEDFRRSEDIECWLRICILTNWLMEGVSEPLTKYRVNASSLSASLEKQFASWQQVLQKVETYAPDLAKTYGQLSLAYRARLLARKAVRLRNPEMAVAFTWRMLSSAPAILWQEPLSTGRVAVGAGLLRLLPSSVYQFIEAKTAAKMGQAQRKKMSATG